MTLDELVNEAIEKYFNPEWTQAQKEEARNAVKQQLVVTFVHEGIAKMMSQAQDGCSGGCSDKCSKGCQE